MLVKINFDHTRDMIHTLYFLSEDWEPIEGFRRIIFDDVSAVEFSELSEVLEEINCRGTIEKYTRI